jgi:putative long chain acyl-CoA synthase
VDIGRTITAPVLRAGALAQNALEVARFGGLETGEQSSPYEVVARDPIHRLRRYYGGNDGPPVVLVPPMMLAAEVWDVSPTASAVTTLHELGMDTYVVDFGAPEREEGGMERDLTDHVLAVSAAVDEARELTGRDVHLGGYSQGGMFCYQTAAYRRSAGLASLITFGSPVDTRGAIPFGLPEEIVARAAGGLAGGIGGQALPAWMSRLGFRLMDPVKAARQQLDFVMALHDREALLPRERQRRFLQAEGWVAWPGPALAEFMRQFVVHNRMLIGGFQIEDRMVTLADIKLPVLTFVGTVDEIAPPAAVRPIVNAAPDAEIYECALRAGHFGLVVGSTATKTSWPTVAEWARFVEGEGALPEGVKRVTELVTEQGLEPVGARAGYGLGLASDVGVGLAKSLLTGTTRAVSALRSFGGEAATQVPRLARLERVRPHTQISLGKLLDEQVEKSPEDVLFLFEDRAHTRAAAKHRIDSVVRGLLSLGVRQGEHVGVLMEARPSALVTTAALNRLGAVTVLLRPGANIALEAGLGQITRVITEPESIDEAQLTGVQVLVLGGGAGERDLGPSVVDMERIDPDQVTVPRWYSPNPGRARDLAFILFTGEGDRTRINRITNRRWALSAFGTASAATLSDGDTVYSLAPPYHPSALLMSLGGAVAGGARIAMARRFDPTTFWEEVRRYGVTVSSYTWTMLRELVDAPEQGGERHHPVRLFIGSGMPIGLWQRVTERFAPAQVLEFYASTQGEAILINVTAAKPGAMGRPLPGSAEVQIAGWHIDDNRLETGDDGFARRSGRGGVPGMLLARVDPDHDIGDSALRGVFERDDAWVPTGDLFRRDEDGDYWLIDPVAALVRTAEGRVAPSSARNALSRIDAVDLAVSYGVPVDNGVEVLVAAVTLRKGRELIARDVTRAVSGVSGPARPLVVQVVDEIAVTTWYRPIVGPLRAARLPPADGEQLVLVWDPKRERYRPLTEAARKRLLKTGSASTGR